MTWGEIKAETLKLMFADGNRVIEADTLDDFESDPSLSHYFSSFIGAFNRYLSYLANRKLTGEQIYTVTNPTVSGGNVTIDLSDISNLSSVNRVILKGEDETVERAGYRIEGGKIILRYNEGITIKIAYTPLPTRLSSATGDAYNLSLLGVDPILIEFAPLYMKSELYSNDEPEESVKARTLLEAEIASYRSRSNEEHGEVETVFAICGRNI